MSDTPLVLMRLSQGTTADDGKTVRFRIEARDERHVEVECDHADIEKMITYLIGVARLAAEKRSQVTPHHFGQTDKVTASPIEASDVGFMRGMESDEIVLVVRMFGFDLGFTVTPYQAGALHGEIERMLPNAMLHPSDHHHHHHENDHDH